MRASPARVMAQLRANFNLSVQEGWHAYREIKAHLDRAVMLVDLVRHPRIVGVHVRAAKMESVASLSRAIAETPPPVILPRREQEYDDFIEDIDYVEFEFSAETEGGT